MEDWPKIVYIDEKCGLQEIAQSAETTPNNAEVTSLNLPPPRVDMSKKDEKCESFLRCEGYIFW